MGRYFFGLPTLAIIIASAAIALATDRSYCEAPHPVPIVPNPVTSTLLQVFVLSRHGDRSPLYALPKEYEDKRIVWNCSLQTPWRSLTSDKTLSSGSGIYFLYENYGTGIFGVDEVWNGNCMTGQLTELGGEMCTRMGAGLRNVYIDKFHLLPDSLKPSDADLIHLRTTDFTRTRESLAALMEGLFPTDKRLGVYLPVSIIPVSTDYLHPNVASCPRLGQLVVNNTMKNEEWMRRFNVVKPILDKVNEIGGTKGSGTWDDNYTCGNWADTLHSRECHKKPFPCSEDGKTCITDEMADALYEVDNWQCCNAYVGDETGRLAAGPFFVDIANYFKTMVSTGKGPKYIHYSGHDSTIATVLAALHYDGGFPPYASTVRFELWQTQDGASPQYAVQIIYNNRLIRPPECSSDTCPYTQFVGMVDSRLTIRDKKAECARQ